MARCATSCTSLDCHEAGVIAEPSVCVHGELLGRAGDVLELVQAWPTMHAQARTVTIGYGTGLPASSAAHERAGERGHGILSRCLL